MQPLKTLNDMIIFLQQRGDKKRVAVVCANDASTRYAVEKGVEMGFIEPIYVDGDDKEECARRAVALCKNGEADILMKGLINTDVLLRAISTKRKASCVLVMYGPMWLWPRFPNTKSYSSSLMRLSFPSPPQLSVVSRFSM